MVCCPYGLPVAGVVAGMGCRLHGLSFIYGLVFQVVFDGLRVLQGAASFIGKPYLADSFGYGCLRGLVTGRRRRLSSSR